MSEQFPNKSYESSKEAFAELLTVLESIKDSRIPVWCANWMREACEQKIISAEENHARHQFYGRPLDAGKQRQSLDTYKEAMRLIVALEAWVRMLSIEEQTTPLVEYLRERYGKPTVDTTATEDLKIGRPKKVSK